MGGGLEEGKGEEKSDYGIISKKLEKLSFGTQTQSIRLNMFFFFFIFMIIQNNPKLTFPLTFLH